MTSKKQKRYLCLCWLDEETEVRGRRSEVGGQKNSNQIFLNPEPLFSFGIDFSRSHAPAWECIPYGFPRWSMGTKHVGII